MIDLCGTEITLFLKLLHYLMKTYQNICSPDTRPSRPSRTSNSQQPHKQQPQQQQPLNSGSAGTSRPDLIGEADQTDTNLNPKQKSLSNGGLRRISKDENLHMLNGVKNGLSTSTMTQGALDIEKVMASVAVGGSGGQITNGMGKALKYLSGRL